MGTPPRLALAIPVSNFASARKLLKPLNALKNFLGDLLRICGIAQYGISDGKDSAQEHREDRFARRFLTSSRSLWRSLAIPKRLSAMHYPRSHNLEKHTGFGLPILMWLPERKREKVKIGRSPTGLSF
jgi:hypothetical protein